MFRSSISSDASGNEGKLEEKVQVNQSPTLQFLVDIEKPKKIKLADELRLDKAQQNLTTRDYQNDVIQFASQRNTIVYMPTGTGKTLVAAEVIKQRLSEVCDMEQQIHSQEYLFQRRLYLKDKLWLDLTSEQRREKREQQKRENNTEAAMHRFKRQQKTKTEYDYELMLDSNHPRYVVVFLTPTQNLDEQQSRRLKEYLASTAGCGLTGSGYGVQRITRSNRQKWVRQAYGYATPHRGITNPAHVFTCTGEVLYNALRQKDVTARNEPFAKLPDEIILAEQSKRERIEGRVHISMIVFDECHHCQGDHSYARIMSHLRRVEVQEQWGPAEFPRILGLSATPVANQDLSASNELLNQVQTKLQSYLYSPITHNMSFGGTVTLRFAPYASETTDKQSKLQLINMCLDKIRELLEEKAQSQKDKVDFLAKIDAAPYVPVQSAGTKIRSVYDEYACDVENVKYALNEGGSWFAWRVFIKRLCQEKLLGGLEKGLEWISYEEVRNRYEARCRALENSDEYSKHMLDNIHREFKGLKKVNNKSYLDYPPIGTSSMPCSLQELSPSDMKSLLSKLKDPARPSNLSGGVSVSGHTIASYCFYCTCYAIIHLLPPPRQQQQSSNGGGAGGYATAKELIELQRLLRINFADDFDPSQAKNKINTSPGSIKPGNIYGMFERNKRNELKTYLKRILERRVGDRELAELGRKAWQESEDCLRNPKPFDWQNRIRKQGSALIQENQWYWRDRHQWVFSDKILVLVSILIMQKKIQTARQRQVNGFDTLVSASSIDSVGNVPNTTSQEDVNDEDDLVSRAVDKILLDNNVQSESILQQKYSELCMVFVERQDTASCLHKLLKYVVKAIAKIELKEWDLTRKASAMRGGYLLGHSNTSGRRHSKQWAFLKSVQQGLASYIVSTAVGEEGLDIRACNCVVMFQDPRRYGPVSFVQARGRARADHSEIWCMVDAREQNIQKDQIEGYNEVQQLFHQEVTSLVQQYKEQAPSERYTGVNTTNTADDIFERDVYYTKRNTCDENNAVGVLTDYCQAMSFDAYVSRPRYTFEYKRETKGALKVRSRVYITLCEDVESAVGNWRGQREHAKQSASLQAVKNLHRQGKLNDKLKAINSRNRNDVIERMQSESDPDQDEDTKPIWTWAHADKWVATSVPPKILCVLTHEMQHAESEEQQELVGGQEWVWYKAVTHGPKSIQTSHKIETATIDRQGKIGRNNGTFQKVAVEQVQASVCKRSQLGQPGSNAGTTASNDPQYVHSQHSHNFQQTKSLANPTSASTIGAHDGVTVPRGNVIKQGAPQTPGFKTGYQPKDKLQSMNERYKGQAPWGEIRSRVQVDRRNKYYYNSPIGRYCFYSGHQDAQVAKIPYSKKRTYYLYTFNIHSDFSETINPPSTLPSASANQSTSVGILLRKPLPAQLPHSPIYGVDPNLQEILPRLLKGWQTQFPGHRIKGREDRTERNLRFLGLKRALYLGGLGFDYGGQVELSGKQLGLAQRFHQYVAGHVGSQKNRLLDWCGYCVRVSLHVYTRQQEEQQEEYVSVSIKVSPAPLLTWRVSQSNVTDQDTSRREINRDSCETQVNLSDSANTQSYNCINDHDWSGSSNDMWYCVTLVANNQCNNAHPSDQSTSPSNHILASKTLAQSNLFKQTTDHDSAKDKSVEITDGGNVPVDQGVCSTPDSIKSGPTQLHVVQPQPCSSQQTTSDQQSKQQTTRDVVSAQSNKNQRTGSGGESGSSAVSIDWAAMKRCLAGPAWLEDLIVFDFGNFLTYVQNEYNIDEVALKQEGIGVENRTSACGEGMRSLITRQNNHTTQANSDGCNTPTSKLDTADQADYSNSLDRVLRLPVVQQFEHHLKACSAYNDDSPTQNTLGVPQGLNGADQTIDQQYLIDVRTLISAVKIIVQKGFDAFQHVPAGTGAQQKLSDPCLEPTASALQQQQSVQSTAEVMDTPQYVENTPNVCRNVGIESTPQHSINSQQNYPGVPPQSPLTPAVSTANIIQTPSSNQQSISTPNAPLNVSRQQIDIPQGTSQAFISIANTQEASEVRSSALTTPHSVVLEQCSTPDSKKQQNEQPSVCDKSIAAETRSDLVTPTGSKVETVPRGNTHSGGTGTHLQRMVQQLLYEYFETCLQDVYLTPVHQQNAYIFGGIHKTLKGKSVIKLASPKMKGKKSGNKGQHEVSGDVTPQQLQKLSPDGDGRSAGKVPKNATYVQVCHYKYGCAGLAEDQPLIQCLTQSSAPTSLNPLYPPSQQHSALRRLATQYRKQVVNVLPQLMAVHPIKWSIWQQLAKVQYYMYRLEGLALTHEMLTEFHPVSRALKVSHQPVQDRIGSVCIREAQVAITTLGAGESHSYERYEMLGDAFLKYSMSLFLYYAFEKMEEGSMSIRKHKMVSNGSLYRAAKRLGMERYVLAVGARHYLRPLPGCVAGQEIGKRSINQRGKALSDVVESLTGYMLCMHGPPSALAFLMGVGIIPHSFTFYLFLPGGRFYGQEEQNAIPLLTKEERELLEKDVGRICEWSMLPQHTLKYAQIVGNDHYIKNLQSISSQNEAASKENESQAGDEQPQHDATPLQVNNGRSQQAHDEPQRENTQASQAISASPGNQQNTVPQDSGQPGTKEGSESFQQRLHSDASGYMSALQPQDADRTQKLSKCSDLDAVGATGSPSTTKPQGASLDNTQHKSNVSCAEQNNCNQQEQAGEKSHYSQEPQAGQVELQHPCSKGQHTESRALQTSTTVAPSSAGEWLCSGTQKSDACNHERNIFNEGGVSAHDSESTTQQMPNKCQDILFNKQAEDTKPSATQSQLQDIQGVDMVQGQGVYTQSNGQFVALSNDLENSVKPRSNPNAVVKRKGRIRKGKPPSVQGDQTVTQANDKDRNVKDPECNNQVPSDHQLTDVNDKVYAGDTRDQIKEVQFNQECNDTVQSELRNATQVDSTASETIAGAQHDTQEDTQIESDGDSSLCGGEYEDELDAEAMRALADRLGQSRKDVVVDVQQWASLLQLEEQIGYRFKDLRHLAVSMCHPTFVGPTGWANYQRYEFLGDALLDLLHIQTFFAEHPTMYPGEMDVHKMAALNNERLGKVAVTLTLHKHLKFASTQLLSHIRLYEQEHAAAREKEKALLIEEYEKQGTLAQDIDEELLNKKVDEKMKVGTFGEFGMTCPKVLGDQIESLTGAIYLDCDRCLDTTWRIMRPLLEPILTLGSAVEHPAAVLRRELAQFGLIMSYQALPPLSSIPQKAAAEQAKVEDATLDDEDRQQWDGDQIMSGRIYRYVCRIGKPGCQHWLVVGKGEDEAVQRKAGKRLAAAAAVKEMQRLKGLEGMGSHDPLNMMCSILSYVFQEGEEEILEEEQDEMIAKNDSQEVAQWIKRVPIVSKMAAELREQWAQQQRNDENELHVMMPSDSVLCTIAKQIELLEEEQAI